MTSSSCLRALVRLATGRMPIASPRPALTPHLTARAATDSTTICSKSGGGGLLPWDHPWLV
eukprot:CAMPEP_0182561164 /NCGR_PEP_ID=MMETSP1324-20130603/3704_1 /TAXON_ID=236786 /ORGANISM="Florenciella sp., Strain RCC1587" /LENGTH=60 /DNA_ID=CAMNT_0024773709 /DNA_START=10 /DNA_END=188 /DNA_ORIENTATION=+